MVRAWRRHLTICSLALVAATTVACTEPNDGDDGGGPVEPWEEFPGLTAEVEIRMDDRGIPHIYGQTDADVMYAAGYQMAKDRLFQMELVRRRALGTQAEVLGESKVEQDVVSRALDLKRWGQANRARLREDDPAAYNLVVAWVAGVNAYIAEVEAGTQPRPAGLRPGELDFVPEPWVMDDVFTTAKLFMLGNSNSLEREILATVLYKFTPDVWNAVDLPKPAYDTTTMPPDELPSPLRAPSKPLSVGVPVEAPLSNDAISDGLRRMFSAFHHIPRVGSNNWAVSGEHTANGRPLVAGDPHQPLQSPNVMYMLHLNSADAGGQFDVVGWAFAGTPGVQLGHNRDIHWAATTNFADVMDLWEVELLDGGSQVRLGGNVIDTVIRTETIEVAGGEPTVLEVIEVPEYGVILPDSLIPLPGIVGAGNGILLNWTGFAATAEERCFFEMNKSTTLEEYEAAVDVMEVGGFNFVAASAEGITYRVNINVPDRQLGADGPYPFLIMDGNDSSSFWTGDFLPPEQLPRSKGGARGYVSSANNDPWGFTFDGDVNNDPWYYGYFYAPGYRAKRINDELDRLTNEGGITVEDMVALQNDTHSGLADQIVPVLETAWANAQTDAALAEYKDDADIATLVDAITTWDRTFPLDSREAVAFRAFSFYLSFELLQDDISLLYGTIAEEEPIYLLKLGALTATGAYAGGDAIIQDGIDATVLEAAKSTAAFLTARYGGVDPSNYMWSEVHFSTFANTYGGVLDGGRVATAGSDDSVNVSQSTFYLPGSTVATDEWLSNDGPIFRVVTGFDDDGTPVSVATTVRGNSGDPDSPHWDDEQADWVAGTPTPIPFRRGEVEAATESITMLQP